VTRELNQIDPFNRFIDEFCHRLAESDLDVLELGSRRREKTVASVPFEGKSKSYLGIDIVAGPNVDIVGDVHQLSTLVGDRTFDLVYSQWVFEHLAMPWVVVSELNKVLRLGGEVVVLTNHSIGLHDLPWDFWRYSESAWRSLFNVDTGFELLEAGLGEPVKITPYRYHFGFREHEGGTGFQASFARARKVADRAPRWEVDPATIFSSLSRPYPKELAD
jgi:SAM-dependent methyltransferase